MQLKVFLRRCNLEHCTRERAWSRIGPPFFFFLHKEKMQDYRYTPHEMYFHSLFVYFLLLLLQFGSGGVAQSKHRKALMYV